LTPIDFSTLAKRHTRPCRSAVRIVALPDDRGLVRLVVEVPVNAVVTDIQLTILVPPDVQIVLRVGNVLDLGKRLDPVDDTGLLRPELLVVLDGLPVKVEILVLVDQSVLLEIIVDGVDLAHRNLHSVGAVIHRATARFEAF
jgi:hypothetical protein